MNTVLFAAARHAANRGKIIQPPWSNFPFADDDSRENYQKELRLEPLPPVNNPIVLVTSTVPGTGKSILVRSLIASAYGDANACPDKCYRKSEPRIQRIVESAIREGRKYVWFDDVSGVIDSEALSFYATVPHCFLRKPGKAELEKFPVNLRFYLSGNQLRFSQDIIRRSRVISLFHPFTRA